MKHEASRFLSVLVLKEHGWRTHLENHPRTSKSSPKTELVILLLIILLLQCNCCTSSSSYPSAPHLLHTSYAGGYAIFSSSTAAICAQKAPAASRSKRCRWHCGKPRAKLVGHQGDHKDKQLSEGHNNLQTGSTCVFPKAGRLQSHWFSYWPILHDLGPHSSRKSSAGCDMLDPGRNPDLVLDLVSLSLSLSHSLCHSLSPSLPPYLHQNQEGSANSNDFTVP